MWPNLALHRHNFETIQVFYPKPNIYNIKLYDEAILAKVLAGATIFFLNSITQWHEC